MEASESYTSYSTIAQTALKAVLLFALIQSTLLVTWPIEQSMNLMNPLIVRSSGTVDYYLFSMGFMNMQMSLTAAAWTIQFCVQFIITAAVYLLLRKLGKGSIFGGINTGINSVRASGRLPGSNNVSGAIGSIIAAVPAIFVLLPLYTLFVWPYTRQQGNISLGTILGNSQLIPSYIVYLFLTLVAVTANAILTLLLAYPLTARKLPGGWIYRILLLAALCAGGVNISEYLVIRQLGLVNTFIPYVIFGFFNIMNILVLKAIFNSSYGALKEERSQAGMHESELFFRLFVPKVWKPLTALAVFQFAAIWNSFYTSMIYINRTDFVSPVTYFNTLLKSTQFAQSSGEQLNFLIPEVMKLGIIAAIPPLLLFLLLSRLIRPETYISQMRR